MMSMLHLIWIVPLSASFGAFMMAIFTGSRSGGKEDEM